MNHRKTGSLTKKKKPIPAEFWKTIRSHEPYFAGQGYTGGSNLIRAMAKRVNQKHTFGLKTLVRISNSSFTGTISEQGTSSILRLPNWDANCNEMILWTGASPKGCGLNYKFGVDLVLDAPDELGRTPAIFAMNSFAEKADAVCRDLRTRSEEVLRQNATPAPPAALQDR